MKNYFEEIKKKLGDSIKLDKIEIIDNSYKHTNHKSFIPGKFHLHIIIKSNYLNSLSKIDAHRLIMQILGEDIKTKIHAIEITIE